MITDKHRREMLGRIRDTEKEMARVVARYRDRPFKKYFLAVSGKCRNLLHAAGYYLDNQDAPGTSRVLCELKLLLRYFPAFCLLEKEKEFTGGYYRRISGRDCVPLGDISRLREMEEILSRAEENPADVIGYLREYYRRKRKLQQDTL